MKKSVQNTENEKIKIKKKTSIHFLSNTNE